MRNFSHMKSAGRRAMLDNANDSPDKASRSQPKADAAWPQAAMGQGFEMFRGPWLLTLRHQNKWETSIYLYLVIEIKF